MSTFFLAAYATGLRCLWSVCDVMYCD